MRLESMFFLFTCLFSLMNQTGCIVCSVLSADVPDGCTHWHGDLSITNQYSFAFLTEKLSAVTQFVGRLSIYGTDFQNCSFFSSLAEIHYKPQIDHKIYRDKSKVNSSQVAFRVENNFNLERLGMDKLMNITMYALPTDISFYSTSFSGNPELCFNLEQTESWMQSERIYIPQYSYCNMKIIEDDQFFKKFTIGNGTKENGGWSKQAMQFINNDLLTELSLPKLEQIHHYGDEAFVMVSGNSQLDCTREICDIFLHLFRFDLNSCDCGIIPRFNPGYEVSYLLIVICESILCAFFTILIYGNTMYHVYKTGISVSYFQFSMLVYLWLSCCEAVYNVVNYVKFIDGLSYPWSVGLQFLLFSNKETYFFQTVNIIYTNRISLLLSCCLYRTISFISFDYGKLAMALSVMIFLVSNIWSFNGLLQNGSQFSYGIYLINWVTFGVSIITAAFLFFYLSKNFKTYPDMIRHQNRLSIAFFSQALLSFIFCGFPDGFFEQWPKNEFELILIRSRRVFAFYYSSTIIRWHYLAYALLLRVFLHDMISKVNIQSTSVVAVSSMKGDVGEHIYLALKLQSTAMKRLLFVLLIFELAVLGDLTDCFVSYPLSQLPDNCTSMTGNLLIDGKNASLTLTNHLQYSVLLQKLSHVEQWTGTIKILNTDFQNLSFFKSLKTVKASWNNVIQENEHYASFWIEMNPNLTTLGMPNLVDVYADVLPTNYMTYSIMIKLNKKLCMSEVEFLKLRTMERSYLFDFSMCEITIRWQWQLLIVRGNHLLKEFSVPKLRNLYHYGNQPQLTNSANTIWSYTSENCDTFRKFPFFSVTDPYSNCGLIPIINNGVVTIWLVAQFAEKVASLLFNIALCVGLTILMFKSNISVNFFHFAMVTLVCLTITENLFVNLDYIHIFDEKGFAIPYGVRSLFFTHDSTVFNQISNVMYVNRLCLLLSCSIYRSMHLTSPYYEKYGLLISCATFVLSNVWNTSVMQTLENKYTYVLYQLNWITLAVTLANAIYTAILIKSKSFKGQEEMGRRHNQLSWSLVLQALWTFVFCGYSDGLNQYFTKNYQFISTVRWWDTFFYWYGGVIMRWHYSVLIIIIIAFLPSTFVKFPQSAKVTTVGSVSKN